MSQPRKVRLAEVVKEAKPGFACGEEQPDGVFQIRMNNVTRDGRLDTTKKRLVPPDHKGIPGALLREGDVLFNATNSPDLVGKTVRVSNLREPTVFSNHFLRLRADTSKLDPNYLARWLNSEFQRGTYKAMCRQWVNQATLGREALLGTTIPLLHLSEQRRIAEVLDRVDALREKRRKSITLLGDFVQSIFIEMFSHGSDSWEFAPLREAVTEFRYGTSNKSTESGFPTLRIPNILGGTLNISDLKTVPVTTDEFDRLRLRDGDLLFVRTNGNADYVGRSAVFEEHLVHRAGYASNNWIYASYLIRARLDRTRFNPVFVRAYLDTPIGRRALRSNCKTSAGQFNMNIKGLGDIEVPSPPIELQDKFADRLARTKEAAVAHKRHLAHLDALFASIQSRAFRGELWQDDVKDL